MSTDFYCTECRYSNFTSDMYPCSHCCNNFVSMYEHKKDYLSEIELIIKKIEMNPQITTANLYDSERRVIIEALKVAKQALENNDNNLHKNVEGK